MHCGIILCRKRRENGYKYCDKCPDYPCECVMEKENRYTTQYPQWESPLGESADDSGERDGRIPGAGERVVVVPSVRQAFFSP